MGLANSCAAGKNSICSKHHSITEAIHLAESEIDRKLVIHYSESSKFKARMSAHEQASASGDSNGCGGDANKVNHSTRSCEIDLAMKVNHIRSIIVIGLSSLDLVRDFFIDLLIVPSL